MAQAELKQLRQKLQEQEREFQTYRNECKVLEGFLEEESAKKEEEIIKLREEAIMREKAVKQLKAENKDFKAQIVTIKNDLEEQQLAARERGSSPQGQEELAVLRQKMVAMEQELTENSRIIKQQREEISRWQEEAQSRVEHVRAQTQKIEQLNQTVREQVRAIEELESRRGKAEQQCNAWRQKYQQLTDKTANRRMKKKEGRTERQMLKDKERDELEQQLKRCAQKIARYEKYIKELKQKLVEGKLSVPNSPLKSPKAAMREEDQEGVGKVYTGCIITTKRFYNSPFLEQCGDGRSVKLYRPSRHGCFEKSLGATKHRMDFVGHEWGPPVDHISQLIQGYQFDYAHSVLIYGSKRTNKKAILVDLVSRLEPLLMEKMESVEYEEVTGLLVQMNADGEQEIREEVETGVGLMKMVSRIKQLASGEGGKKAASKKGRICYFGVRMDEFSLQIATSSLTQVPSRGKQLIQTLYNNVLYSRLKNVLPPSHSQKYMILTLNPIVQLYEECKNTLGANHYRLTESPKKPQMLMESLDLLEKEGLNQKVKKQVQQFQKIADQSSNRARKLEEELSFFRSKFEDLSLRLNGLISTHSSKNSYLKKSPIILTFQKLLRFVNGVQGRNNSSPEPSALNGNVFPSQQFELDLHFDEEEGMEQGF